MLRNKILFSAGIEEQGLTPLLIIIKKLGGWPVLEGEMWKDTNFNWISSVYNFRELGYSVDYFLDFSIGVDLKNSTKRVLDVSVMYDICLFNIKNF